MHVLCVCVPVPEEPVCRGTPVGDIIEEDLQLVVIVKVGSDDGANWRRHGKLLGCDVLRSKNTCATVNTHTHTHAEAKHIKFFPWGEILKILFSQLKAKKKSTAVITETWNHLQPKPDQRL